MRLPAKRLAKRAWESPTLTTWGSFAARSLTLVLVLPLALKRLSAEEFAVWSSLSLIIGLQWLAEMGFGTTFSRVVAYAMGGAQRLEDLTAKREDVAQSKEPNWELLTRILATMRSIYGRLTMGVAPCFLIGGTLALWNLVGRLESRAGGWGAWAAVYLVTTAVFHANQFANFLQGSNHVALLRRWETLFALGSIGSTFAALWLDGGLFWLVTANQTWTLLGVIRNRFLSKAVLGGRYRVRPKAELHRDIFAVVWPNAWRSGIGSAMSYGLVQASGLFHAQSKDLASVNSYLLGLRIVQAVSQFSQAPFYSKLPALAKLYAAGRKDELVRLAKRGMSLSYWSFVVPMVVLLAIGPSLLAWMGSSVAFPGPSLWLLLTGAVLAERFGAMHLQLYSTTNHIVWHIANGVTGSVIIGLWALFYPRFGAQGLALGMLLGNVGFYCWFCALRSHRAFGLGIRFDAATVLGPLLLLIAIAFGRYAMR